MLSHVDNGTVGIADEEAAKSPFLIADRVDDLSPCGAGSLVYSLDVVDLNRHIGVNMRPK